ncbi:MAG: Chromosome partition protein Smc [Verrucomicrobia subdivision 3 bacterium]|nr:Chromosome partition protein Smc [Limisphaerales bacterium]MCS1416996.1 Chromosome partition protein Smc [Limisphaerales bacterium]
MKRTHTNFNWPLFISFNELAWLALVGVVLISAGRLAAVKDESAKNEPNLEKQLKELTEVKAENRDLHSQLAKAKAEKRRIEERLESLKRELVEAKKKTLQRENEISSLIAEKRRIEELLQSREQKLAEAKNEISDLSAEKHRIEKLLQSRETELAATKAENRNLHSQLAKAKAEKRRIEERLESLKRDLEEAKKKTLQRENEISSLSAEKRRIEELLQSREWELAEAKNEISDLSAEKHRIEELLQSREQELATAKAENRDLHSQLAKAKASDGAGKESVHKKLLGLKGDLEFVGILLDRSSSMKGERWEESKQVVETWLEHLAMKNCFLITFNEKVDAFPPNRQFLDVSGADGGTNRSNLIQKIQGIQPEEHTGTLDALEAAYRYPNLQTIILFTDGEPRLPRQTRKRIRQNMRDIVDLCRTNKRRLGVTVNTVAIGDYFQGEFGKFLIDVAKETDGAFIGR